MDIWYAVVPLVGVLAVIAGWFYFSTWAAIRQVPIERIVAEQRPSSRLHRGAFGMGAAGVLLVGVALWAIAEGSVNLAHVVLSLIFVVAAFFLWWAARRPRGLSLQGHLILNAKLRRMYFAGESIGDIGLARLVRRRVEEWLTFHEARFRRRNLRIDEVLDRVCPTVGEGDE